MATDNPTHAGDIESIVNTKEVYDDAFYLILKEAWEGLELKQIPQGITQYDGTMDYQEFREKAEQGFVRAVYSYIGEYKAINNSVIKSGINRILDPENSQEPFDSAKFNSFKNAGIKNLDISILENYFLSMPQCKVTELSGKFRSPDEFSQDIISDSYGLGIGTDKIYMFSKEEAISRYVSERIFRKTKRGFKKQELNKQIGTKRKKEPIVLTQSDGSLYNLLAPTRKPELLSMDAVKTMAKKYNIYVNETIFRVQGSEQRFYARREDGIKSIESLAEEMIENHEFYRILEAEFDKSDIESYFREIGKKKCDAATDYIQSKKEIAKALETAIRSYLENHTLLVEHLIRPAIVHYMNKKYKPDTAYSEENIKNMFNYYKKYHSEISIMSMQEFLFDIKTDSMPKKYQKVRDKLAQMKNFTGIHVVHCSNVYYSDKEKAEDVIFSNVMYRPGGFDNDDPDRTKCIFIFSDITDKI